MSIIHEQSKVFLTNNSFPCNIDPTHTIAQKDYFYNGKLMGILLI